MTDTAALVRRYYDAFNAKDFDGMLACVADDIRHDVNEGDRRGGARVACRWCRPGRGTAIKPNQGTDEMRSRR